jgi:hypothetical protein
MAILRKVVSIGMAVKSGYKGKYLAGYGYKRYNRDWLVNEEKQE